MGLGVLFFIAGAFAVNLPKGGAWMMGIKWVSGVGLAYMAFAYLRDRFEPVHNLVAHPSYTFGIVAGVVFLVGIVLGVIHMIAERRKSPIAHLSKPMKLASIVPAVVGCALFVSWVPQPHGVDTSAPEITWVTNEEQGRAKATAENKPVLIDFGASWCTACKELEHNTFPNPGVRTEAQRFIAIRVDATDDEAPDTKRLQEKYKVDRSPDGHHARRGRPRGRALQRVRRPRQVHRGDEEGPRELGGRRHEVVPRAVGPRGPRQACQAGGDPGELPRRRPRRFCG